MLVYPATIIPDGNGFMASFRDIPEALTGGPTLEEVRQMAADALATAMEFYFEDGRSVPLPSAFSKDDVPVVLPASMAAKILLLNEMLVQKVTAAELARRLGTTPQSVNRIMDLKHPTKIDVIAEGLSAVGQRLHFGVRRLEKFKVAEPAAPLWAKGGAKKPIIRALAATASKGGLKKLAASVSAAEVKTKGAAKKKPFKPADRKRA